MLLFWTTVRRLRVIGQISASKLLIIAPKPLMFPVSFATTKCHTHQLPHYLTIWFDRQSSDECCPEVHGRTRHPSTQRIDSLQLLPRGRSFAKNRLPTPGAPYRQLPATVLM